MNNSTIFFLAWVLSAFAAGGQTQDAAITIRADQVLHPVSHYLTGACIEDVNHEIYGGIDSQMIFGESFAEAVPQLPLKGLNAYGGRWTPDTDGSLLATGGDGPKLICDGPDVGDGEASVEMLFSRNGEGNAGLIVRVSAAADGADKFNGYEAALDPSGMLVLGRHRQNWELIRRVPCEVPFNKWVTLRVRMSDKVIEVFVNGKSITQYEDTEHPLSIGAVGLRTWQMDTRFRNLSVVAGDGRRDVPFTYAEKGGWGDGVSGTWGALRRGTADGRFSVDEKAGLGGGQSQRITFASGTGEIGIENESLNRWGMNFVKGNAYEGYVWARAASPTELFVSLESRDGAVVYSEKSLKLNSGDWQRLDFALEPNAGDKAGRFAIKLKQPGAVTVGYTFLQPGSWGRFKDLPVRKDVAQGLIDQDITVLRDGGNMANASEYRWKKMMGPRANRPSYVGWWYPRSSNGWGVFDFLNFCEAARFAAVPDLNAGETPQDMADFIEYVNGSKDTTWGGKRAEDGHPKPYNLKYLEIGNEEQVNESYWQKFKPIAEAIWAKDPSIILIVGDFAYDHPIIDPFHFTGAAGRITSLSAQQKILQLAKEHDCEVWFDVHVWTEGPRPTFGGTFSYIDALDKLAEGAKHRVVIFELNAGNHSQRRALANAAAINAVERDGRLPIVTSANCLQPDGQNDNGWDQGLLFLNPAQVWLQPPGYVTQMISRNYQPLLVKSEVKSTGDVLDASVKRSEDNKTVVLQVVNISDQPTTATINLAGFIPSLSVAKVETLAGPLDARNTADQPEIIKPSSTEWKHGLKDGVTTYTFLANSFTVIKFK
jgi:hypothetical protein